MAIMPGKDQYIDPKAKYRHNSLFFWWDYRHEKG